MNDEVTVVSRRSAFSWRGRLYKASVSIQDERGLAWHYIPMPMEVANGLSHAGLLEYLHDEPEGLFDRGFEVVSDDETC